MSLRDSFSGKPTIPYLRPWQETAVYDEEGRCVLPSRLAWEGELSYARDKDLSLLRYVKRHIRVHGFGHPGGYFHNAYSTVKEQQRFSHEMIHLWLGIWGTMDSYVSMPYQPFYDGNTRAEATVTAMQDIVDELQVAVFDQAEKDSYIAAATWRGQEKIVRHQAMRNKYIISMAKRGVVMPVYDAMRREKRDFPMHLKGKRVTALGEAYVDPLDQEALSIKDEQAAAFFDACLPCLESLQMTIDGLQVRIGQGNKPLSSRTVDMMFRTLKVREFYDVMHSGEPRVMTITNEWMLRRVEQGGILKKYDRPKSASQAVPKVVAPAP